MSDINLLDESQFTDIPLGISRKPKGLPTVPDLTFSAKAGKFRISDGAIARLNPTNEQGYLFRRHIQGHIVLGVVDKSIAATDAFGRNNQPREQFTHNGLAGYLGNPTENVYFNLTHIGRNEVGDWYKLEPVAPVVKAEAPVAETATQPDEAPAFV